MESPPPSSSSPAMPPPYPSPGDNGGPPVYEEIAFFDVETTVPSRSGQGFSLLEFGAILVCPRRLVEVGCFSTLIRPADLSTISATSIRCNGITRETVAAAPTFAEVADRVYAILHGRVWAGHNILRFDCARIREAFAEIGRPAPEPKGTIDSLPLLTQRFGRRAGNMKMATLAAYFGLGQQRHRSLDDVRMNLEVLKYCSTVLFLESCILEPSPVSSSLSPTAETRIDGNTNVSPEVTSPNPNAFHLEFNNQGTVSSRDNMARAGTSLIEQMKITSIQRDAECDERLTTNMSEMVLDEGPSSYTGFLEPDSVSKEHITATLVPTSWHGCRIALLHGKVPLQLCCTGVRLHFGISTKFLDNAGRPKLSIVLDAPASLCQVLDVCENIVQRVLLNSGSSSEWRPLIKKNGFSSSSTVRLNITTSANEDALIRLTEIYQKEPCGNSQKLDLSKLSAAELDLLFASGTTVDAYFCVDTYDYQQYAGIRLLAKRLVVHTR